MTENREIRLSTNRKHGYEESLKKINEAIVEGWYIEEINCNAANDNEVEADLIFYFKQPAILKAHNQNKP